MVGCGKEIAGFRLRVGTILAIRYCLRLLFAWTMAWASLVVLLRVSLGTERGLLVWGLLGYVPATAAGILLAARKIPSPRALRAALDRHGRAGGLLMAAGECDIGPWSGQIPPVAAPAVRLHPGRYRVLLPAAAAFLAAAFLVPNRHLPFAGGDWLQVGTQVGDLSQKLELLRQEQLVPAEKAQVLERNLERIRQEASGSEPAKTMEAIDHLEQSFGKAAKEAAESAIRRAETASRAEELAQALEKVQGQVPPEQMAEALKELAQMTEQAAAESKSLAESLDRDLLEKCRQGNLTEEQLKQLAESLAKCKECERATVEKLVKARLVDVAELDRMAEACEGREGDLAAVLGQGEGGKELAAALEELAAEERSGLPGRGGRDRGRGDAAMTWSKGTTRENVAFKEKVLSPAAVASLKQSRLAGVSSGDPTAAKPGAGSSGGALGSAQAGGGAARTQIILPEHEKTVRRYFDREK
jgi:hypothetical protein